jgi:hypothetical protein
VAEISCKIRLATQGIVSELRLADLLSNDELYNLGFKTVHFLKEEPFRLKPLVLPVCFFAGKIQQAMDTGMVDAVGLGVLSDAVNLLLVLTCKLSFIDRKLFEALRRGSAGSGISLFNQPQNYYHVGVRLTHFPHGRGLLCMHCLASALRTAQRFRLLRARVPPRSNASSA